MTPKDLLTQLLPAELPDLLGQLNWTVPPVAPPIASDPSDTDSAGGARIVVVGQEGTGKKSLCNALWGWEALTPSSDPVRRFGRLTIVVLPAETDGADDRIAALADAQLIVYVLDASRGLNEVDFMWLARLRALNLPILAAANKADLLDGAAGKRTLDLLRARLNVPVIPLIATNLYHVHHDFLPAVLKAFPAIAESLAGEIGGLRRRVAYQMTIRAAISTMVFNLRSESGHDLQQDAALLVSLQMRLMRRIGMLYGFRPNGGQGRELILMVGLRLLFRRMLWLSTRYPVIRAWMLYSLLAFTTTVLVGRFAVIYYSAALPGWLRWL